MPTAVMEREAQQVQTNTQQDFRMVDDVKVTVSYAHADDAPVTELVHMCTIFIVLANCDSP